MPEEKAVKKERKRPAFFTKKRLPIILLAICLCGALAFGGYQAFAADNSITYDYNGGAFEDGNDPNATNHSTYDGTNGETITLTQPMKEGYTFSEWTVGTLTFKPSGSHTDKAD